MYLKSLELYGFKSFANLTPFVFSQGMTAIVGPNGSGKSNIVDAVRWVMGEQSAKSLRGQKMEDIIFAGTTKQKPVGMARVTMTLDNSDHSLPLEYDEVEVTRVLHRSGESEYLMNGKSCRLKDIHELFMDTGLGKDGLAIIGQGKVDEILMMHAEERRGLVEEAAGISKYKYKKREAERKLASTKEDILRLEDIYDSLANRLPNLEQQAEDVQTFYSLDQERHQLELDLYVETYEKALKQKEKAFEKLQNKQSFHQEKEATLAFLKKQKEEHLVLLKEESAKKDDLSAKLQSQKEKFQEVIHEEKLELQSIGHLTERLQEIDAELKMLSGDQDTQDADFLFLQEKLTRGRAALAEKEQQSSAQKSVLAEREQALLTHDAQRNALSQEYFNALRERAEANNQWVQASEKLKSLEHRKQRISERVQMLADEKEATEKKHTEQKEKYETCVQEMLQSEKRLNQLKSNIAVKEEEERALQEQQSQCDRMQTQVASKLQALQELEESGRGYYAGVAAVIQEKNRGGMPGIIGPVAQLIQIPEIYTTAIEIALGSSAQHLICQTEKDASGAIEWLKANRKGRATFLPLNRVAGRQKTQPTGDGVIGWAVDLIDFDAKYQGIMNHLLGHILIVENLSKALKLQRSGIKERLVTLEGDVLTLQGSMTGGLHKKQNQLLRRGQEIKELQKELTKLTEQQEMLKLEVEQHSQWLAEGRNKIRQQTEAHASLQTERQTLQYEKEMTAKELERTAGQLAADRDELHLLEKEYDETQKEVVDGQNKIEALDEAVATLEKKEATYATNTDQLRKEVEVAQKAFHQLEIALSQQNAELQVLENQCASWLKNQEQKEQRQETLQRQQSHHQSELAQIKQSLETLSDAGKVLEKRIDELQMQLVEQETKVSQLKKTTEQAEEEYAQAEMEQKELMVENIRLENDYERAQEQLEENTSRLQARFSLSLTEALKQSRPIKSLQKTTAELNEVQADIDALGQLNFQASKQLADTKEEANYLKEQLDDMLNARLKLEEIIEEMESTMAERFRETYKELNERFSRIFKDMFQGGDARLSLSMPHNILETGVDIMARPPGKVERALSLLSGGEKALTAIALLFALLEVRPAPFVILDEIETALDQANVERFAHFVSHYSHDAQFIVVSHRKGTMEAADILYGITMDRKGVSKPLSVRMSDYVEGA